MVGLDPVGIGDSGPPDFHVEFLRKASPADAPIQIVTIVSGAHLHDSAVSSELILDNPVAIACFVLSHALGMPSPILTANASMFAVVRAAMTLVRGCSWILIEGGIGSGKSMLARLIHAASRSDTELIRIDCAGLDNELTAGLFDVSRAASAGEIVNPQAEAAPPRVIYLNHLNELSPEAQLRLKTVLESSRRTRENAGESDSAVRYVASLSLVAREGASQAELMPELRALFDVTLAIPPLCERPEDITLLARHFLKGVNPELDFSEAAIEALKSYSFPGNVRELHNLVTRIGIMHSPSRSPTIERADVAPQLLTAMSGRFGANPKLPKTRRESAFARSRTIANDAASGATTDNANPHPLIRLVPSIHGPARKPRSSS